MRGSKSRMAWRTARSRSVTSSDDEVWPAERRKTVVDDRAPGVGKLRRIHVRVEARGVEQPGEIAKHRLAHAPLRHHPHLAGLELLVRLVVGQAVEQRRLQLLLRGALFRHWPRPECRPPRRGFRAGPRSCGFPGSASRRHRSRGCAGRDRDRRPRRSIPTTSCARGRSRRRQTTSEPGYRVGMSASDSPPLSKSRCAGIQTRSRRSSGASIVTFVSRENGTQ